MTLPNFLVIGISKAGTTALYRYLGEHPQIFLSAIKEPGFFAFGGVTPEVYRKLRHEPFGTTIEDYKELFCGVTDEQAIGEMSIPHMSSRHFIFV